jgi:hypothetical protein
MSEQFAFARKTSLSTLASDAVLLNTGEADKSHALWTRPLH